MGGYEHYEATGRTKPSDGDQLPVFRWAYTRRSPNSRAEPRHPAGRLVRRMACARHPGEAGARRDFGSTRRERGLRFCHRLIERSTACSSR
ncbi:DUF5988 family protein [Yinghuangia aomiensis]